MYDQDSHYRRPRSEYELGQISRSLFRCLGVEVGPGAARSSTSLLAQLLPAASGRGLSLAIHAGIRDASGVRGPVSAHDEIEWLAGNLRLEALRDTDRADALHRLWAEACAVRGLEESTAEVDPLRLAHEVARMALAEGHHELAVHLAATLRDAGSLRPTHH